MTIRMMMDGVNSLRPCHILLFLIFVSAARAPCAVAKALGSDSTSSSSKGSTAVTDESHLTRLFVVATLIASVSAAVCCVWFRHQINGPSPARLSNCPQVPTFQDLLAPFKRLTCPTWCRSPTCRKCRKPAACSSCPMCPESLTCCRRLTCPCLCELTCFRTRPRLSSKIRVALSDECSPSVSYRSVRDNVDSAGYTEVSLSPVSLDDTKFFIPLPTDYNHLGVSATKPVSPMSLPAPTKAYDHVVLARTESAPTTDSEYMACASKLPSSATAYDVTVIDATTNRVRIIGEVYDKLKVTPLVTATQGDKVQCRHLDSVKESETL